MPFVSRRVLQVVALIFLSVGVSALPASARHHDQVPSTGLTAIAYARPAPDFVYDIGTGAAHLSGLVGRPVVLNFWATWCQPCRAELDAFARLQRTYGESVTLLTISPETPGVARAFLRERDLDFPVVEDPDRKIFDAYTVTPIPVTIVLGRDGAVGHVSVGQLDWMELQQAVDAAGAIPIAAPVSAPASSAP